MAQTKPEPIKVPDPPPGLDLSPLFNIEGHEKAADWVKNALKIPATGRWIHEMTITGKIVYSKYMGRRFYSRLELYRFVMSQAKVGGKQSKAAS